MTPRSLRRAIASLAALDLGLAVAVVWAFSRLGAASPLASDVFAGVGLEEAAVAALVSHGAGVWDAHPDPDVARVLQPGLEGREYADALIDSNAWGLREREFGEKPEGTVRVVLLGDSFVFGQAVPAEHRLGVFLEEYLRERSGAGLDVEVLHVGISSWNVQAECAFMRRNLGLIEPDLVVQLVLTNDLSDCRSVRGFGSKGMFSAQVRARASGLVDTITDVPASGGRKIPNHMPLALDREARERYEAAAERIGRLADAVRRSGGEYLLLPRWTRHQPLAKKYFAPVLKPKQLAYVSDEFVTSDQYWVSPSDFHWNREGNAVAARFVYGLVQERGLLPELQLAPWPEAAAAVDEIDGTGRHEARDTGRIAARVASLGMRRSLDVHDPSPEELRQIYGGVYRGQATSYVSLFLRGPGVGELVVRGARMGKLGLAGRARVYAEEFEVGSFDLAGEGRFHLRFPLPAELAERPFVNVRFVSDDYARRSPGGRCVSFELRRVEIQPTES